MKTEQIDLLLTLGITRCTDAFANAQNNKKGQVWSVPALLGQLLDSDIESAILDHGDLVAEGLQCTDIGELSDVDDPENDEPFVNFRIYLRSFGLFDLCMGDAPFNTDHTFLCASGTVTENDLRDPKGIRATVQECLSSIFDDLLEDIDNDDEKKTLLRTLLED